MLTERSSLIRRSQVGSFLVDHQRSAFENQIRRTLLMRRTNYDVEWVPVEFRHVIMAGKDYASSASYLIAQSNPNFLSSHRLSFVLPHPHVYVHPEPQSAVNQMSILHDWRLMARQNYAKVYNPLNVNTIYLRKTI